MSTYFASQYLNCIELETSYLLFNGGNGAMDEVSKGLGNILQRSSPSINIDGLSETELNYLNKRGHITLLPPEKEISELKKLVKTLQQQKKEQTKKFGHIMFLLSYSCNLDCEYCYQRGIRQRYRTRKPQAMTPEFVENVFSQHFTTLFPDVPYERITIALYGGEPFLPHNTKAIMKILELTKEIPVQEMYAVTNGTQLGSMLNFFGPLPGQVNSVQISLDGDQESHDKSRIATSKEPTFQQIIANIHRLLDKKVRINLRVNIASESIHKIYKLVDFLEEQELLSHPFLYPYVHPIHCHYDQTEGDGLLSTEKVSEYLMERQIPNEFRNPVTRQVDRFRHLLSMQRGITGLQRTSFCMMNVENNFIIDPYGDLYKCYEEAGREEDKVGKIHNGKIKFLPLLDTYVSRNISAIEKCAKCSVALACGGECGAIAKAQNGDYFIPYCEDAKPIILKAIKHLYLEKEINTKRDIVDINSPNL